MPFRQALLHSATDGYVSLCYPKKNKMKYGKLETRENLQPATGLPDEGKVLNRFRLLAVAL
jgi:hypothetical protein